MKQMDYWNRFKESGKVADYLNFCKERNAQMTAFSCKGQANETQHQGTDTQGTEYRGAR